MKLNVLGSYFSLFFLFFSSVSYSCYRSPRQLESSAARICKQNGNHSSSQHALVQRFKESIKRPEATFRSNTLQTIVNAVAHNNSFKKLEENKCLIHSAIDKFHNVPGFLSVLARVLDGALSKNSAHFSGALGEMNRALQRKKILEFSKKIYNDRGKLITEIDLVAIDENGNVVWEEVKCRTRFHDDDAKKLNAQVEKQKALARIENAKHSLVINFMN